MALVMAMALAMALVMAMALALDLAMEMALVMALVMAMALAYPAGGNTSGALTMANPKGKNAKSKHPPRSMTQSAEQKENAKIKEIASKASSLSDPLSDIRLTDYWACKPK
jgi:predicted lipid-binding transport protein (Tim44 family)